MRKSGQTWLVPHRIGAVIGRPPPTTTALIAIVLVAAGLRFWGIDFGLPHTQARPDETTVIDVVLNFLRGNFRPNFFDYPWLYMKVSATLYLGYYAVGLAAGWFGSIPDMLATWPTHWEPFFLINRSLSAVCGTLTVIAVHGIARRVWDRPTALAAALLMATSFLHVRESHYGTTDAMMTMWLVLSTLWVIDGHQTGRRRSFVLAGLAGGLAAATKYNAGVVMFPVLVSQALQVIDAVRTRQRPWFDGRMFWFGVPSALVFLSGTYFIFTDYENFSLAMQALGGSMAGGHGAGDTDLSNGWLYHLRYSIRYGVGITVLSLALAGLFLIRRQWRLMLVLLTLPVVYFLVIGSIKNLFFRYALPLTPFLCLLAAHTVLTASRWLTRRAPQRTWIVATALTLLAAAPATYRSASYNHIASQKDSRVLLAEWFLVYGRAGENIAQSGSPYGHAQIPRDRLRPWVWDRHMQTFVGPRRRIATEGLPDYLVIQESPLPSVTQPLVEEYLANGYTLMHRIDAYTPDPTRVYDMQDAFFIPFAGFRGVERPGPNFLIYRKNDR